MGLIGVVSLPRAFVFRLSLDDPHPVPWIRVKLSCAMGQALHPHPQWNRVAALWESFYPLDDLDAERRDFLGQLEATMPAFVALLLHHRPASLHGRSLVEALGVAERQPARLAALFDAWSRTPPLLYAAPASLAFAVIGQARAAGRLTPEDEGVLLTKLLTHWALRSTLDTAFACAAAPRSAPRSIATWVRREQHMTIH